MTGMGSDLLAASLKSAGVKDFFFLIGGPTTQAMDACVAAGIRGIDVRDERAAAFAAIAYSRVGLRPGVVLTGSGPDATNTITGVAHAEADGAPLVVIGGSAPLYQRGLGAFQELDQVSLMRPVTKWAHQINVANRIPDAVRRALQVSMTARPGPVYLDVPADVLYEETDHVPEYTPETVAIGPPRAMAGPELIARAAQLLAQARRPIVIVGSGVLWSQAAEALKHFVEATGIPFFTTPTARGVVSEDHPQSLAASRSTAFREADCLLIVGTRVNYVLNWLRPPSMSPDSTVIEINMNAADLSDNRVADVAIHGDARVSLEQMTEAMSGVVANLDTSAWTARLAEVHAAGLAKLSTDGHSGQSPLHPLELCTVLNQVLSRDTIRIVDGHEILGFSRRGLGAYGAGHMLTPGVFGTMGVGVPFGVGAKVADPSAPVVVLTGDGAFGFHAMELDTAVRHGLGVLYIIANNGGWTGSRGGRPGRDLGHTPYHRLADVVGCMGVEVLERDKLEDALRSAMDYVRRESKPAIVNVTVATVQSSGRTFIQYDRTGRITEYQPA